MVSRPSIISAGTFKFFQFYKRTLKNLYTSRIIEIENWRKRARFSRFQFHFLLNCNEMRDHSERYSRFIIRSSRANYDNSGRNIDYHYFWRTYKVINAKTYDISFLWKRRQIESITIGVVEIPILRRFLSVFAQENGIFCENVLRPKRNSLP